MTREVRAAEDPHEVADRRTASLAALALLLLVAAGGLFLVRQLNDLQTTAGCANAGPATLPIACDLDVAGNQLTTSR